METKVVFFDIGGTLIGSPDFFKFIASKYKAKNVEEISKAIRVKYNEIYDIKEEDKFKLVREILEEVLKDIAKEFKVEDLSAFAHSYYEEFYFKNAYLYEDVVPCLKKLKEKGVKLVVLSDSDADILIGELKKLDIYEYFEEFVISGEVGAYKPADKIINNAAKFLNKNSKAFMVGNSDVDILSAKKLKATAIVINRDNKVLKCSYKYNFNSLKQLVEVVIEE